MKIKIFKFKKVKSTNDTAMSLIRNKITKPGCVFSGTQTQGRGTRGKKWVSYKGNLFISIFFELKKNYPPFNEFSIINPIIIKKTLKNFCKNQTISLKYPNDLLLNGKKFCGILQEMITFDNRKYLIIGIGININSNPKVLNKIGFTNILQETKKKVVISQVIEKLITKYENFFSNLQLYNYKKFKIKAELMVLN